MRLDIRRIRYFQEPFILVHHVRVTLFDTDIQAGQRDQQHSDNALDATYHCFGLDTQALNRTCLRGVCRPRLSGCSSSCWCRLRLGLFLAHADLGQNTGDTALALLLCVNTSARHYRCGIAYVSGLHSVSS